ncbi:GlsB/YeaQ/YmgE family stress response membrane protein [Kribbella pittospori]|uniref:GlsB/YeaQ/YmgE family stress response membrane protein n=1 Tax=Kribbella pittospori TaxID=722689 RepID=A0A4R0KQG2_9ACTN|nr:GlsB/YeaQ/YmgE family stress response membrane protein [Kribbella pittospori]TCC60448.1 GlsB/YeaQ/YmgE family stress response membrane protein [Kribbella pittospori]
MVGALLLGFVCGVIARVLMPRDAFRGMSGPVSWAVSLGLGLAGAVVGYVIFTLGLGIGDTDIFDWGGLIGAVIGTLVVIVIAGYILRRRQARPPSATTPPGDGRA